MSAFQNQQRDYDVQEIERKKKEMQKEYDRKTNVKFYNGSGDILEEEFKNHTVGLVTREEFKKKQESISVIIQNDRKKKQEEEEEKMKYLSDKRKQEYQKKIQQLSFADDDDNGEFFNKEEEEEYNQKKQNEKKPSENEGAIQKQDENSNEQQRQKESLEGKDSGIIEQLENNEEVGENAVMVVTNRKDNDKELGDLIQKKQFFGKNPNIDTSFLPDKLREEQERIRLDKLKEEYNLMKKVKMQEFIQIRYCYWDGFKLKKALRLQKKCTVVTFIDQCKRYLMKHYVQFQKLNVEDLLLVIKDVIIPQKLTFFDIIEFGLKNKKGELLLKMEKFQEKIQKNIYEYEADVNAVAIIYERAKYEASKYLYPISSWHALDENKLIDEIK